MSGGQWNTYVCWYNLGTERYFDDRRILLTCVSLLVIFGRMPRCQNKRAFNTFRVVHATIILRPFQITHLTLINTHHTFKFHNLTQVPMSKPVAGVEIGLVNGVLTVNPTKAEMESSSLQLTVAGTKDGILMIEGAADFLPEELMVEALKLGGNSDLLASDFSFSFLRILKFFLVERYLSE